MEVSFSKEVELLRLGQGQTFQGEGILTISDEACSDEASAGAILGAPIHDPAR
jgi:indolepyruvate ferredoxin oxidoreductase, alpha subunit